MDRRRSRANAAKIVTKELEAYRFNEAAGALYKFVWNVFCDWYLELIKPMLKGEDEDAEGRNAPHGGLGAGSKPDRCCIRSCRSSRKSSGARSGEFGAPSAKAC